MYVKKGIFALGALGPPGAVLVTPGPVRVPGITLGPCWDMTDATLFMPNEILQRFVKKYSPKIPNVFQPRGRRFLDGNVEYVIPAQRRIRFFGKRFMESEMTSILV